MARVISAGTIIFTPNGIGSLHCSGWEFDGYLDQMEKAALCLEFVADHFGIPTCRRTNWQIIEPQPTLDDERATQDVIAMARWKAVE